jgi:glycosyltransferase involved in cell wall biosynthesis
MPELHSPRISIGMPVRNSERSIATAICSILHQTFSDWELLVLDDGSSDSTVAVSSSFHDQRIRLMSDGFHSGLPARLNQAVRVSRGRYFARMDGDDVAFPERLARQAAYLDCHPEIDLVASSVVVFQSDGRVIGQRKLRDSHEWLCGRPWASFPMPHPTWMGRIEWFQAHPYHSAAVRCEDQELLLRAYQHSRFGAIEDALLGYREDRLGLSNLVRGRINYACAAAQHFWDGQQYGCALACLAGHTMRLFIDCFAVTSGLNHTVLRHRARPAPANVMGDWKSVWSLNAAGQL